ncbi:metallophosphoesterase [Pedobacter sp. LMG 31464]|uniref:Metallophosphoesterase n=1 Tax=Pedobacter planticolens TaxID=2679964 RepID=A0A923DZ06_9SPHI|nr:metallophosphoesterase [Pedobacter planticolens]MBB2146674.1 metallophosphoesterase [Pedobacter planticolens]
MGRTGFLTILCLVVLLLDFYCYKAIISVFKKWSAKRIRNFTITWWTINILLIIGVFSAIFLNLFLTARAIILVAFFLLTVGKVFMLPFLLIDDLRRFSIKLIRLAKTKQPNSQTTKQPIDEPISRSSFLVKAGLVAAAVPLSSLSWGIISGAYDYKIKRVKLVLPNLPKAFDGIKLGQISDIHSGSFYNKTAVKGGVEMLLAEKPDFIFFTGDLVNNLTNEVKDYQDIFSKVKAPLGVYSTLGNHDYGDYYFGKESSPAKVKNLQDMITTHKLMGYDLLMNENRRLKVDGEEIGILGIENWGMGRFPKYGKMELAYKNTEDLPVKLLLSHDPSHWRGEVLEKYQDVDAMFSGHTHGMQFGVRLKEFQWSPVQYIYKEWAGLYREKAQQLYVNVGYGFLGYPGRVGILPEITIFELTRG